MLRIGVLAGGGGRDDVAHQLSPVAAIDWHERADALVGRATEGAFDAVVTGLRDGDGRSIAPTIVELAAYRPSLPVILHFKMNRVAVEELLAVFAVGLRLECVVRPFGRLEPMVRHVLSPLYRPGVAPLLLQHFTARVPEVLLVFVVLAILAAPARRGVEELAAWSGVSSRTIERRLHREGWPSAHVLLQSFTALDAVWLMTEYRWPARADQRHV